MAALADWLMLFSAQLAVPIVVAAIGEACIAMPAALLAGPALPAGGGAARGCGPLPEGVAWAQGHAAPGGER